MTKHLQGRGTASNGRKRDAEYDWSGVRAEVQGDWISHKPVPFMPGPVHLTRQADLLLVETQCLAVFFNLIAPNRHGALFVDELEAVHAEVGGRRVAYWRRIPRGQERLRGWVAPNSRYAV